MITKIVTPHHSMKSLMIVTGTWWQDGWWSLTTGASMLLGPRQPSNYFCDARCCWRNNECFAYWIPELEGIKSWTEKEERKWPKSPDTIYERISTSCLCAGCCKPELSAFKQGHIWGKAVLRSFATLGDAFRISVASNMYKCVYGTRWCLILSRSARRICEQAF